MTTPKSLAALAILVSSLAAGSALAGPDWSIIERGRAAKQAGNAGIPPAADKRAVYSNGPRSPYLQPQSLGANSSGASASKEVVARNAAN